MIVMKLPGLDANSGRLKSTLVGKQNSIRLIDRKVKSERLFIYNLIFSDKLAYKIKFSDKRAIRFLEYER